MDYSAAYPSNVVYVGFDEVDISNPVTGLSSDDGQTFLPFGATFDALYKSGDTGLTWTLVSDPTTQQFGLATFLDADLRVRDVVYIDLGGRGILRGSIEP